MFSISLQLLPLAALMWTLWVALLILVAVAGFAWRWRHKDRVMPGLFSATRWGVELGALLLIPLFILGWGLYFWPPATVAHWPRETSLLAVVSGLDVLELSLAGWLMWRHRQRLLPTFGATALALWWTAGASFAASMAISNTWL
jgi:hypothetical protein